MIIFFFLFSFNILFSSLFVILATNPVYSILYLIFLILNTSGLLLLLGSEFLAFLLIIIYVGAIAVLFLFVVMMLDVKILELSNTFYKYLPISFLISLFLILFFIFYFNNFNNFDLNNEININIIKFFWKDIILELHSFLDFSSFYKQVQYFSSILYIDYFFLFFLIAILLLFSMIGVIIITLNKNIYIRRQDLYSQINKNVNDNLYLIDKKIKKNWNYFLKK